MVVFSMFRGFGLQRVLGIVAHIVWATFNGYVIVGYVVVLLGVLYCR